jgi:hypothetical protein
MKRRSFLSNLIKAGSAVSVAGVAAHASTSPLVPAPPKGGFQPGQVYVLIYDARHLTKGDVDKAIDRLGQDGVVISASIPAQWWGHRDQGNPDNQPPRELLRVVHVESAENLPNYGIGKNPHAPH